MLGNGAAAAHFGRQAQGKTQQATAVAMAGSSGSKRLGAQAFLNTHMLRRDIDHHRADACVGHVQRGYGRFVDGCHEIGLEFIVPACEQESHNVDEFGTDLASYYRILLFNFLQGNTDTGQCRVQRLLYDFGGILQESGFLLLAAAGSDLNLKNGHDKNVSFEWEVL
jgi:hypothetical protein